MEVRRKSWGSLLATLTLADVALNHDSDNGRLALGNLLGHIGCHLWLILVILVGVAVATIHHQTLW